MKVYNLRYLYIDVKISKSIKKSLGAFIQCTPSKNPIIGFVENVENVNTQLESHPYEICDPLGSL